MSTTEAPLTAWLFQKPFGTKWYNMCDFISSVILYHPPKVSWRPKLAVILARGLIWMKH